MSNSTIAAPPLARISTAIPEATAELPIALSTVPYAHTVRHVDFGRARRLLTAGTPRLGDVVLAEVVSIGQHGRLESSTGRRVPLQLGMRVLVAYGPRYAPDQFEAEVPADLGPCNLVAAGGLAGRVISQNALVKDATELQPLGILLDEHNERISTRDVLNTERLAVPASAPPLALVVVGSSMNSGKTTTCRTAVAGFAAADLRVGAVKVTGSGAGNDTWAYLDSGAHRVLDFTDFGYPSTWGVSVDELVTVFERSLDALAADCDVVVVEIADGLLQPETAALLKHPRVRARMDGLLFASVDALGAIAGMQWLHEQGLDPFAVTGLVTASPLAVRELTGATGFTTLSSQDLRSAECGSLLATRMRRKQAAA